MAYLVFHHSNDAMIRRKLLPSKLDQMTHIQRCVSNDSKNDLVGGAITILKNDGVKVNGKDDIPYMKWKIKNVWNHQPDDVSLYGRPNYPIPLRIFADFSRVVSNVTAKIHTSSKRTSCGTKLFRARFLTTRCDSLKGSPRVLFSDWLSEGRINMHKMLTSLCYCTNRESVHISHPLKLCASDCALARSNWNLLREGKPLAPFP